MGQATPTPVASPSRWRTWLGLGVALILGGLLLAGLSLTRLLTTVPGNEAPAVLDAPVTVVDYYEPDTYVVYQSQDGSRLLQPDQVQVRGAAGEVPVNSSRVQESITDANGTWVSAAQFTIEEAGEYTVAISASETQVRVATSLMSKLGGTLAWGSIFGVGALLALSGLVLLIVGLARRPGVPVGPGSDATVTSPAPVAVSPAGPPAGPPAGWYADPTVVGGLRYWDGTAWTEHSV